MPSLNRPAGLSGLSGLSASLSDRGKPVVYLERVGGGPFGGVAEGRHKFKTAFRKGVGVAVRRGRSPGLLPTLLPSTPR